MRRGYSLIEVLLVAALLAFLAFLVVPNLRTPLERSHLPESGERLRALVGLTRANAMLDGLRYRMRYLEPRDEMYDDLAESDRRQPFIEIESDPIGAPGEFVPLRAAWATGTTFLGDVWCYSVRWGEPTFESVMAELQDQELEDEEQRKRELGLEEDDEWVMIFEPDGTSDWMTFRLIDAPPADFDEGRVEGYPQLDVIVDGRMGMVFLQRPLGDEELDVLLDKGHSPILRRDFLRPTALTEDDVLEIDMRPKR